ncbi:MAG: tetratricopeptide repeat protein [Proteobacteria bacterium]|nr:tetratricopeptide repeat protein [Pseudomonadota bacterium]
MTILNKEKILEQAKAFVDEGRLDKAIREYEKITLADPSDLRVKLRVAELYTKRKQIGDAIRIYREVANSYTADGFLLKAVTVYKNILRLNPSLIEVNEELAGLYEKMGLMQDAVRQYDILASTLDMKGMPEKVIDIRRKIVALNPEDGSARVKLAETFQREGRTEEAIDQYEDYAARLERAGADRRKLADVFEKILAHRPKNYDLMRKLISIYEELADHKKALRWLEEGKEMSEQDPDLLKLAAAIYTSQNQVETARGKYMLLADLETENGNPEKALDAYFEILVMLPDEEDRLFKRVEEIKPGAMPGMLERAAKRRLELEAEEERRQIEEETEKTQREVAEREEREDAERLARRPRPKAAPAAKPEPQPQPQPQPEPQTRPDRSRADSAYKLGLAYRKMGLEKESCAEFAKALKIYSACAGAGMADDEMKGRIREMEAQISGDAAAAATPKDRPVAPSAAGPLDAEDETEKGPVREAPAKDSGARGKKKVSFI